MTVNSVEWISFSFLFLSKSPGRPSPCPCGRPQVSRATSNLNPSITQRQPWRNRGDDRNRGMRVVKNGGLDKVMYSQKSSLFPFFFFRLPTAPSFLT